MNSEVKSSKSEFFFTCLEIISAPNFQALKLRQHYDLHSLKDIAAVAERAGYEVCYTDLPMSVSGFAQVIAGRPSIVVNRFKPPKHQQYTIAHELAHHILYQDFPSLRSKLRLPSKEIAEVQAHLFAAMCVISITDRKERDDVLRQNPEALVIPVAVLFMTLATGLIVGITRLWSRLFTPQL